MKRWKKALSGLLMAALMVTGISFPENVFAVSAGMDGLPSVVDSGIGKKVDTNSTIDGTYNFTPVIGANTKVSFGSTDGTKWDNQFCVNGEKYATHTVLILISPVRAPSNNVVFLELEI